MAKKRRWTVEQLKNAVETGGNYDQIKKYIKEFNCSIKHLKGSAWNKGLTFKFRPLISLDSILIANSSYQSYKLKKRLFFDKIKEEKCERCGWSEKSIDGRIPVELDHINGDRHDNRIAIVSNQLIED